MRILLDTNTIIHREANHIAHQSIGTLFRWIDKLKYEKCVHPFSVKELEKHANPKVRETFKTKIQSYHILKTLAPTDSRIAGISLEFDSNENDRIDTAILNELYSGRVDALITEDRKMHRKAEKLDIAHHIFSIDSFLEKVTAENPELSDYNVLAVRKELFGNININDSFFDSLRTDYPGFDKWFNRKADETAYVCRADEGEVVAFLYLKKEGIEESYSDITPTFKPTKRLKVGTFKVISNGYKLGERFLKIIFDNAVNLEVEEIYVTAFDRTPDQQRLIALMQDWGFYRYGEKSSKGGNELVFVRDFRKSFDKMASSFNYPYFSTNGNKFLVPIYPDYHTELFPDSILRNESRLKFIKNRSNRNAISKVFISRALERNIKSGDILVFYRTAHGGSAYYTAVTTTLGIVQNVISNINSEAQFIDLCRKRSVFTDEELSDLWNQKASRPFIVNFLYTYSFPKRMIRKTLLEKGIVTEGTPRGFERINDRQFELLLDGSNADRRIIVN